MTAFLDEANRLLTLAKRDQAAFLALLGVEAAGLSVACFHAQQAAEKSIKAILVLHGIEFRRTHDLLALASLLAEKSVTLPVSDDWLTRLTPYAVEFRYDDDPIHLISGRDAEKVVTKLINFAEQRIIAIPDELAYSINEPKQSLMQKAKYAFVMTLLAEHKLSISQAAHWLELSVYETMQLAGQQQIDLIDVDDLADELAQAMQQQASACH